jgi:hypothetical protein
MIGEIIPAIYDVCGKPVSGRRNKLFSYPLGRYVIKPLKYQCSTIEEIRKFLQNCQYISDRQQFNKEEFWLPPHEFEKVRKGDCDEFALWTWRQLIGMGYQTRFVIGRTGRSTKGHAWVTIAKDSKHYIVEPQAWRYGEKLPRLKLISYQPAVSVEWDGKHLHYFAHRLPKSNLSAGLFFVLLGEWLLFWIKYRSGLRGS